MRFKAVILLSAIWTAGAGCALSDPIVAWEKRVEGYIEDEGGGDLVALRDVVDLRSRRGLRPARITFGYLGIHDGASWPFGSARDVQGVLVGVQEIDDQLWYLFLVGVMRTNGNTTSGIIDIRLVGLAERRGQRQWRISTEDADALAIYRTGPQHKHPEGTDASFPEVFPTITDIYRLSRQRSTTVVVEERSGARWWLTLAPAGFEGDRRSR